MPEHPKRIPQPIQSLSGAAVGAALLLWGVVATAQPAIRIIDRKPFDRMVLKENNQVLKLHPLEINPRRPLVDKAPDFTLRLQIVGGKQRYEVAWVDVKQVTLFEEMVLAEAVKLKDAGKFEEAYEYYVFLEKRDPKFPGVAEAFASCLLEEARHWIQQKRWDLALGLLHEVHRRDAKTAGLPELLAGTTEAMVAEHFNAKRYKAARLLVQELIARYPQHPTATKWRDHLIKSSKVFEDAARKWAAAQDLSAAHRWSKQALELWPSPTARQLRDQVQYSYPIFTVAVTETAAPRDVRSSGAIAPWAQRRLRGLVERRLAEPVGAELGRILYRSPLAAAELDGTKLTLKLAADAKWSPSMKPLLAVDVARSLLSAVSPGHAGYDPLLAELLEQVGTPTRDQVELRFRRTIPRPQALLRIPLKPWDAPASGKIPPTLGSFQVAQQSEKQLVLRSDTGFLEHQKGLEIIERRYATSTAALGPLVRGELVACDRIAPWNVARFRQREQVTVGSYAMPTVHLLVPNRVSALAMDLRFRRALRQSIPRRAIVRSLTKTDDPTSGRATDSPFPGGPQTTEAEPIAYDARTMFAVLRARQAALKPEESESRLRIRLAHSNSAAARRACRQIKQQLELEGRGPLVQLREISTMLPDDAEWDFCYFEWSMCDPQLDAMSFFTLIGAGDDLRESLSLLVAASDEKQAMAAVTELEQRIRDRHSVLPLWQLTEYYAHATSLQGVGEDLCNLYQNLKAWRQPKPTP